MNSTRRVALATAAIASLALAGCSGSNDVAVSSGSPGSAPAATQDRTPRTAPSGSAPDAPVGGGDIASKAELITLAQKVGCADPSAIKPKSTSPAAKFGIPWAINCEADGNQYIIMAADKGQRGKIMNSLMTDAWSSSKEVGYVADDGWMVIGGPKNSKTPPTKQDAVELQKKVGGSVEVATK